jgi:hypothetical protein
MRDNEGGLSTSLPISFFSLPFRVRGTIYDNVRCAVALDCGLCDWTVGTQGLLRVLMMFLLFYVLSSRGMRRWLRIMVLEWHADTGCYRRAAVAGDAQVFRLQVCYPPDCGGVFSPRSPLRIRAAETGGVDMFPRMVGSCWRC